MHQSLTSAPLPMRAAGPAAGTAHAGFQSTAEQKNTYPIFSPQP